MKKEEIQVGGFYLAKVSNRIVTVRVDSISNRGKYPSTPLGRKTRDQTVYGVTNTLTGRQTTFRSATKFRGVAQDPKEVAQIKKEANDKIVAAVAEMNKKLLRAPLPTTTPDTRTIAEKLRQIDELESTHDIGGES